MRRYPHSKIVRANAVGAGDIAQGIGLLIGLILVGFISYKALSIEFLRPLAIGGLVVVFGCVAFVAIMVAVSIFKSGDIGRDLESARAKIRSVVEEHLETLARRRLALVGVDHYGIVDGSKWNAEVQRFIDGVVRPQLSDAEARTIAPILNQIFQELIEDRVRLRADEIESELKFSPDMTAIGFERWCARTLSQLGWKSTITKATGDQGADVLAERDGLRIILQCKLYSTPVGNNAVQEAYAAQRHYSASASAVVSNAEFTRSARELSNTTGVFLLHYGDLNRLDSLLAERGLVLRLAKELGPSP